MIGQKISRHVHNQSDAKPKPIVTCSHTFSRAWRMYLLRDLIGSLDCLRLFLLGRVITLVLVLRHSNKNRFNPNENQKENGYSFFNYLITSENFL